MISGGVVINGLYTETVL